jgi:hypothetical protein
MFETTFNRRRLALVARIAFLLRAVPACGGAGSSSTNATDAAATGDALVGGRDGDPGGAEAGDGAVADSIRTSGEAGGDDAVSSATDAIAGESGFDLPHTVDEGTACALPDAGSGAQHHCCNGTVCNGYCNQVGSGPHVCECGDVVGGCPPSLVCCGGKNACTSVDVCASWGHG